MADSDSIQDTETSTVPFGPRFKDETGNVYGKLTVLRFAGKDHRKQAKWLCRCECGETTVVQGCNLRTGHTRSCSPNCLRTTHKMGKTPEYAAWWAMHDRCTNPKNSNFRYYGARGISVCEQWATFEAFYADMGPCPEGLTLDRIDNDGNYEPGNVRWATRTQQQNNRSNSKKYEHDGLALTVAQWAKKTGIEDATLRARLNHGWSVVRAITEPVQVRLYPTKE